MGYFSNFESEYQVFYEDHSIVSYKQELLWRVEELQEYIEILKAKGTVYSGSSCYTTEDLRYMLPQYFHTIFDVEKAIELAVEELKITYGIDLYPDPVEEPGVDEITENQTTFFLILPGIPLPTAT